MLNYTCKHFTDLSLVELYDILTLRQEVFIVEQNCPYLDADQYDKTCWHIFGQNLNDEVLAYTRLLSPGGIYNNFASVGRVITSPSIRRSGEGKILMDVTLEFTENLYPKVPIKISAQTYLMDFYKEFGFYHIGDSYLEDGIPHIAMIRDAKQTA